MDCIGPCIPKKQSGRSYVLVIDDNKPLCESMVRMLRSRGFEAEGQSDAVVAATWAAHGDWDLVLCDLRLPHMGGIELLDYVQDIRARHGLAQIPFIIFTGQPHRESEQEKARMLGAMTFLDKPFTPDELTCVLRESLAAH